MKDLKAKPFYLSDEDIQWVKSTRSSMSLEEKIGQLFCLIAYSSDENYLGYLTDGLKIGGIMCRVMSNEEIVKTTNFLKTHAKEIGRAHV